jgi:hypothetical protein
MEVQLRVLNALGLTITDRDQRVVVGTHLGQVIAQERDGLYVAIFSADLLAGTILTIAIQNPRYYPFSASFDVVHHSLLGLPTYRPRPGDIADAVAREPDGILAIAVLSRMIQVDQRPDPLKIASPQDGNWFHKQLAAGGSFFKGDEKPLLRLRDPVVGAETAKGVDRLLFDIQSPCRPKGRIYVLEYKTITAPRLVMVWHPVEMDFSKPKPAGADFKVPYHFYFHPTAHDRTHYPYGKNANGDQPHVGLGYRHTMYETWANVQHYYSRKRVVYVVPVGSVRDKFGEAGTSLGMFTILSEINLALHRINGANFGTYQTQPLGRVAVSGFSAGADSMVTALLDRSSPTGQGFLQNHVAEIYNWDGAIGGKGIPNTVPASFGKLIQGWWRHKGQFFRVYTSNSQYDSALSPLAKYARPTVKGAAGSFCRSFAQDGVEFGTLVHLPDGFFRQKYKPHEDPIRVYTGVDKDAQDQGFPSYVDTHHWFSTVMMSHALSKSSFPVF